MKSIPMQIPYGAVYFRKSNPPKEDWARDYAQAARDSNNIFRHWFMWGGIEVKPGVFDWGDYDRQMELAEENNIKVIIAEISTSIPEWLHHGHPELLHRSADGRRPDSVVGASSATGGFCGGLCLDNEEGRRHTERFLRELAGRYKGSPALLGYDVWNECSVSHNFCHCEHTARVFRGWLNKKYGSLDALAKAWRRYSYTEWEQVKIPSSLYLAPECLDWLDFKKENAYRQFEWRIGILRSVDEESLICAHGMALSLENMADGASDEWLAARLVDVYGLTFVQSRKGAAAWKQFQAVDLTRSGSRGKTFWHAEAQGGPLWLQPQLPGRPREDGRITSPSDLRFWNMTSLSAGARGILYPRWRPLLDGPLFGGFGPYAMDGRPTPCSEMAGKIAAWCNNPAQRDLMKASPVRGELGLVVVPESQSISLLLSRGGSLDNYKFMASGIYKCFFDINIQADFVHIDDIDDYEYLYLPYPLMLNAQSARKIADWVKKGGSLVSEGCPAYFGDLGSVGAIQPNSGLDEVFGVLQEYVEFTPDLLMDFSFDYNGRKVYGSEYIQTYRLTGAKHRAKMDGGRIIAAENSYGEGSATLIGTCLSKGSFDHQDSEAGSLIEGIFKEKGLEKHVEVDCNEVKVRLHKLENRLFAWVLNPTNAVKRVEISFASHWNFKGVGKIHWAGGKLEEHGGGLLEAEINAKDLIIFEMNAGLE
ncbi:MAG: beta-galactosidase [Clostridiales bacterium]|nr:beta-galactosidase [Clostridiales bacterium]